MKPFKEKDEKLKKALMTAYHAKEKAGVGEGWQMNVMNRIRNLGPLPEQTDSFALFGQTVWRLAPAACVLIIALTLFLVKLDFIPEYELVNSLMSNPAEFTLEQLFPV